MKRVISVLAALMGSCLVWADETSALVGGVVPGTPTFRSECPRVSQKSGV